MSLSSENLGSGSAEERATFGLFSMAANERLLIEGVDNLSREMRHGPHVSGYPLAEWLAWNWWRIRWELGRPVAPDAASRWDFAHRLSTIGNGYAWPNTRIFSDGLHSFLVSEPSRTPDTLPFRYLGAARRRETVPAQSLEEAGDGFVEGVLDGLKTGSSGTPTFIACGRIWRWSGTLQSLHVSGVWKRSSAATRAKPTAISCAAISTTRPCSEKQRRINGTDRLKILPIGIQLDDITQGQAATHREERSMGMSTMPDVPEQQPLFFRRPTHQPHPPDSCTRVDGCNGAAFETISRSLRLCGDQTRALD